MNYVNLITSSVYSVEVPPTFIVNFFKSQVFFGLLELAVEFARVGSRVHSSWPLSVSSEAAKEL